MIDKIYHTNEAVPKHYHVANSGYISDEMSGTLNSFDHVFVIPQWKKGRGRKISAALDGSNHPCTIYCNECEKNTKEIIHRSL